ncbi:MAG: RDD family protein [Pseudomonadota bacterium]
MSAGATRDLLDRTDRLMSPEGVPIRFEVAGLGARFGAQLADIVLSSLAAIALVVALTFSGLSSPQTLVAVTAMVFLFIRIPYYVLSELAWNGQTIGKRFMQIKVVSNDGGALTTHALVVRNLMKEAEIFLPGTLVLTLSTQTPVLSLIALAWVIGVLLVPILNKRSRRLGDLIAGTYVVHLPKPILLADLAQAPPPEPDGTQTFVFLTHHLDHYGIYELQTLEQILRARDRALSGAAAERRAATDAQIVEKIRRKIDFADAVPPEDHERFLRAFYNAQRAHLEQRQLFGDQRTDKYHKFHKQAGPAD